MNVIDSFVAINVPPITSFTCLSNTFIGVNNTNILYRYDTNTATWIAVEINKYLIPAEKGGLDPVYGSTDNSVFKSIMLDVGEQTLIIQGSETLIFTTYNPYFYLCPGVATMDECFRINDNQNNIIRIRDGQITVPPVPWIWSASQPFRAAGDEWLYVYGLRNNTQELPTVDDTILISRIRRIIDRRGWIGVRADGHGLVYKKLLTDMWSINLPQSDNRELAYTDVATTANYNSVLKQTEIIYTVLLTTTNIFRSLVSGTIPNMLTNGPNAYGNSGLYPRITESMDEVTVYNNFCTIPTISTHFSQICDTLWSKSNVQHNNELVYAKILSGTPPYISIPSPPFVRVQHLVPPIVIITAPTREFVIFSGSGDTRQTHVGHADKALVSMVKTVQDAKPVNSSLLYVYDDGVFFKYTSDWTTGVLTDPVQYPYGESSDHWPLGPKLNLSTN